MSERDMYVKGSLAHLPFPKTLNYIHQAAKTGILAIVRGPKKVHIHFESGQIVYMTNSFFPGLSLGEYLVKQGKISQEVATDSFEKTRSGNVKQGMYLVQNNFISPHDLYDALNMHVTLKLYTIFEWPEGDFFFKQSEIIEPEHRVLKIHIGNLIYIGIRDYYPLKTLPTEFKGRKEMLLFRRQDCRYKEEDMAFGPTGTRVLSVINGQHSLRQAVAFTKFKKSTAYKMLYAMYLLGFIGFPESVSLKEEKKATFQERVLKEQEVRVKKRKSDGYEISIDDSVIEEAVRSVDRIKQTLSSSSMQFDDEPETVRVRPAPIRKMTIAQQEEEEEEEVTAPPQKYSEQIEEDMSFGTESEEPLETQDSVDLFDETKTVVEDQPAEDFQWEEPMSEEPAAPMMEETSLDDYTSAITEDTIDPMASPDDLLKQALHLINENHFEKAEKLLNRAIELNPNFAEAFIHLGWCIYNRSAGLDFRAAEETVKKGLRINPHMFQAFLYLGKMYKQENQGDFAELHFVKAVELNVDCTEAKEEIRKIRTR